MSDQDLLARTTSILRNALRRPKICTFLQWFVTSKGFTQTIQNHISMESLWTTDFRNKQHFCIAVMCNLIWVKYCDPILCMTWVYLRKDILPQIFWNFEFFNLIESLEAILWDEHRTLLSNKYFGYSANLKWTQFFGVNFGAIFPCNFFQIKHTEKLYAHPRKNFESN